MKKISLLLAVVMLAAALAGCGGSTVKIESADDLMGKVIIGVQDGTTGAIIADGLAEDGQATVQRFNKGIDAVLALKDNKIDAVILDSEPAKALVAVNTGLKIISDDSFAPEDYAIAVKKGNTELLGLIDVVLTEIKADGTYDKLIKGFIDTPPDERDEYITGKQEGTNGELVLGTNAEFPPFEYKSGDNVVGLDIELAKLIAKKANKTLVIKDIYFDSLLMALASGDVDFVIAGMTVDSERKENADFSLPYYTSKQVIIVKADD